MLSPLSATHRPVGRRLACVPRSNELLDREEQELARQLQVSPETRQKPREGLDTRAQPLLARPLEEVQFPCGLCCLTSKAAAGPAPTASHSGVDLISPVGTGETEDVQVSCHSAPQSFTEEGSLHPALQLSICCRTSPSPQLAWHRLCITTSPPCVLERWEQEEQLGLFLLSLQIQQITLDSLWEREGDPHSLQWRPLHGAPGEPRCVHRPGVAGDW